MDHPAVSLTKLCVGFGRETVLKDITLAFPARRTTGLIGPGGSGKSTLLKMICGRDVSGCWQTGLVERMTGEPVYVPQFSNEGHTTLRDELSKVRGASVDPANLLAGCWPDSLLLQEELGALLDTPSSKVAAPLRKLVSISVALARGGDLLVLDEPDSNLSAQHVDALFSALRAQRGQRTIIVATHNMALVRDIADEVVFVLDGQLIETGATEAVFESPREQRTRDMITWGG